MSFWAPPFDKGEERAWRAKTRGFLGETAACTTRSNFSVKASPGLKTACSALASTNELGMCQTGELLVHPSSSRIRSSMATRCLTTKRGS